MCCFSWFEAQLETEKILAIFFVFPLFQHQCSPSLSAPMYFLFISTNVLPLYQQQCSSSLSPPMFFLFINTNVLPLYQHQCSSSLSATMFFLFISTNVLPLYQYQRSSSLSAPIFFLFISTNVLPLHQERTEFDTLIRQEFILWYIPVQVLRRQWRCRGSKLTLLHKLNGICPLQCETPLTLWLANSFHGGNQFWRSS